jgi:hypothetical protein
MVPGQPGEYFLLTAGILNPRITDRLGTWFGILAIAASVAGLLWLGLEIVK